MTEQFGQLAAKMTDSAVKSDLSRLAEERSVYEVIGNRLGFESLHTGSSGARSREDCLKRNKAFYTGFATSCIATAIVHPDIGMGATHINTVTRSDVERYILENLKGKRTNGELLGLMQDPVALLNAMVTEESRVVTVREGVDGAVTQFGRISGGGIPSDAALMICGGFYISKPETNVLRLVAEARLEELGFSGIPIISRLGKDNGVMFGYSGHPQFKQSGFFNLQSFEAEI